MSDYQQIRDLLTGAVRDDVVRRLADGALVPLDPGNDDGRAYLAWIAAGGVPDAPPVLTVAAPDNPTLSDWRVALTLWGRLDDVTNKVRALAASSDAGQVTLGRVAQERLEYANNVVRAQLMQLRGVFGFTEAEVEESLWRADRVRQGDLSGVWPLPVS